MDWVSGSGNSPSLVLLVVTVVVVLVVVVIVVVVIVVVLVVVVIVVVVGVVVGSTLQVELLQAEHWGLSRQEAPLLV